MLMVEGKDKERMKSDERDKVRHEAGTDEQHNVDKTNVKAKPGGHLITPPASTIFDSPIQCLGK